MHALRGVGFQMLTMSVFTTAWLIYATRGQVMTPDRIVLSLILATIMSAGFRLVLLPKTKP